jgi:hypothetical protein
MSNWGSPSFASASESLSSTSPDTSIFDLMSLTTDLVFSISASSALMLAMSNSPVFAPVNQAYL